MTTQQIRKQSDLHMDFHTYVIKDDIIKDQIPLRSFVIITDPRDAVFTKRMIQRAQSIKRGPVVEAFKRGRKWVIRRMKRVKGVWQ